MSASIAAASVAIAASNSNHIRENRCKQLLNDFKEIAEPSIEAMKEYASCVDFLYPDAISPNSIVIYKFVFVLSLIVGIYVAVKSHNEDRDVIMTCLGFVFGLIATPLICFGLFSLLTGIIWIFN